MKSVSKKIKKIYYILIPIVVVAICVPLSFTSLDNKLNDLFIRFLPPAVENENVVLVEVDDALIDNIGTWPLTRDVYADMLNVMRRFEPESFVSDLSFVDKSPFHVDQDYFENDLPRYVDTDFDNLDETAYYVMDGLASGGLSDEEATELVSAYSETTEVARNNIKTSVSNASKDYDVDLANALRFFGDAYLTLWMDVDIDMKTVDRDFLMNNLALENVVSNGDTLTPEVDTVKPALETLMYAAGEAGFVNADPDADGYRRRLYLLKKYQGKYFPQLVFQPILQHYGYPQVVISNRTIVLKDAQISPTEKKDIVIPRCEDGTVLIRFPPKKYLDYESRLSGWSIYRLSLLEKNLVKNINAMNENGYFDMVWDKDENPSDLYSALLYIRDELSSGEETDFTYADYKEYLDRFYEETENFLEGDYERSLLEIADGDSDLTRNIMDFFRNSSEILAEIKKANEKLQKRLHGSLCIIGTNATSTTDYGVTAYDGNYANVGSHSSMANQILSQDFIDDSPWYIGVVIAMVAGLAYVLICFKVKTPTRKMIVGVLMVFLIAGLLLAVFLATRKYFYGVVPIVSMIITFIIITVISLVSTSKEKKFIQEKFGAYVAPEIVTQLVKHPESATVGGDSKNITALFSDVKTFSGFTETVNNVAIKNAIQHNEDVKAGKFPGEEPLSDEEVGMKGSASGAEHLVAYLNDYLGALSDAIMKEHGTIDKYVGDEIVSFFGAPIDDEDNAWNACVAGIRMLQAEAQYNREHLEELPINPKTGKPFLLNSRVGINSGDMVVGNMGTTRKMNYTVMGNNVNLASRLEGTNKAYNSWIMCSDSTWKAANARPHNDELIARRFDCVQVVNVVQPVQIHNILGLRSELPAKQIEAAEIFNRGIELYLKGMDTPEQPKDPDDLKKAYSLFKQALECYPDDKSSEVFMQRCMFFVQNGMPKVWDGVYTMTSK
ncbi:MAG: CHASE2 domain-containing protein [Treponema sp.]|nr:CHASE2 domain-containing protein [Treponema sp.]